MAAQPTVKQLQARIKELEAMLKQRDDDDMKRKKAKRLNGKEAVRQDHHGKGAL